MIKSEKINEYLDANASIGILLLRIFIGGRLIYGVIDNILSWERMIEFSNFLNTNNFPFPIISAVTSVYIQFFGAILVLVGYKLRLASFILSINFMIALVFFHFRINDTIEGMTPALAMLFGCLTLLFTGPDKLSLTNYFASKN